MIRINLLPVKAEVRRQFGKQQLLLAVLLLGGEVAGLYSFHRAQAERLEEHRADARQIQSDVEALERQNAEADRLRAQRTDLQGFASILEGLERNRSGPVRVLDELKEMLNPPANDLQRVSQERRAWNTAWDPRTVWISSFAEANGDVEIAGKAMSNDDVAEFLIRLASSPYFSDVQLAQTAASTAPGLGAVFAFEITATVSYAADEEG
ncbi:MAG: PilN domain-containing protein [Myxococcales bacterium]|nr:PilN domain-containing protein [Myxococcales bacterium]MCB9519320.1 PilN domain-containing protein [Myxococcales bacterium]MCB9530764.1 PilN domain-containing protein [Myxococcales bacterium]MCB9533342.1 PilN domain-containing protein [Myxococcales bacterium]